MVLQLLLTPGLCAGTPLMRCPADDITAGRSSAYVCLNVCVIRNKIPSLIDCDAGDQAKSIKQQ
jgi:hypothetical protein